MELSLAMSKYTPIRRDSHNYVTHLLFIDDMLIFSKASKASIQEIKNIVERMKNYTGLPVNPSKVQFSSPKGAPTEKN